MTHSELAALADRLADVAEDYRFVIPQFHAQNRRKMKARADTLDTVIADLRQLAARLPGDGWLPIESAPRDGRWLLLTGGRIRYGWDGNDPPPIVVGQSDDDFREGRWQFAWYDGGYYGEYETPTHWQPLPPTPIADPAAGIGEKL